MKTTTVKAGTEALAQCESRLMRLGIKPNHSSIIRMALAMFADSSIEDVQAYAEADAPLRLRGRPKEPE